MSNKPYWRFKDLKEAGIVGNWVTLARWIRRGYFPPPIKLGGASVWEDATVQAFKYSRTVDQRRWATTPTKKEARHA